MKKRVNKSAQQTMGLPFSLIFAIFLIIIFIALAFIAVKYFLDIGKCAGVGQFYEELQKEVDESWVSQSSDNSNNIFKINLPYKIKRICFWNLSSAVTNKEDYDLISQYEVYDANLFLIPPENACNMPYKLINHLDIGKITQVKNPYCVDVLKGLIIKKGFYDKNVFIQ